MEAGHSALVSIATGRLWPDIRTRHFAERSVRISSMCIRVGGRSRMTKYLLIGAPHCGKTTLGRRVSELLQIPFFDTDVMAKEKMGEMKLIDAFSSYFNRRICENSERRL